VSHFASKLTLIWAFYLRFANHLTGIHSSIFHGLVNGRSLLYCWSLSSGPSNQIDILIAKIPKYRKNYHQGSRVCTNKKNTIFDGCHWAILPCWEFWRALMGGQTFENSDERLDWFAQFAFLRIKSPSHVDMTSLQLVRTSISTASTYLSLSQCQSTHIVIINSLICFFSRMYRCLIYAGIICKNENGVIYFCDLFR